jgi:hypothetical protein
MSDICKHERRKPWDCFCTYGPPSCQSCAIRSECVDCRKLLKLAATEDAEGQSSPNVQRAMERFNARYDEVQIEKAIQERDPKKLAGAVGAAKKRRGR